MYKLLSHILSPDDPGWPGEPTLEVSAHSRIGPGSVSETYVLRIFNHFGTHIDAPKHFVENGKRIADFPAGTFVFDRPLLLDIPKSFGGLVTPADLSPHAGRLGEADLLLIRSGTTPFRKSRPADYAARGPALASTAAKYLMDEFPNLRAVGSDWISIASPAHMPDGVYTHHYLLGRHHERFMFIIEDMNLTGLDAASLRRVIVAPLFVHGIDSAPATVYAETAE